MKHQTGGTRMHTKTHQPIYMKHIQNRNTYQKIAKR